MTFMRPEWLWLFIILLPASYYWLKISRPTTQWQQVIEADLFKAVGGEIQQAGNQQRWLLPTMLTLFIIALAGPALTAGKVKTATQGNLVVILDNSLSMAATDLTPDRSTRAKRMIIDWTQSGLFSESSVIVYSGSAHWLTPFTRDAKTLDVQLAPVTPFIMPALGNHPEYAFELLQDRLKKLPAMNLNILWLTDDFDKNLASQIDKLLPESANKYLAVVGTEQGSAIPLPNENGFLTDGDNMVIVKVDRMSLYQLGQELGFTAVNVGDQPTTNLLNKTENQTERLENTQEIGYWLIVPIMMLFIQLIRLQPNLLLVATAVIGLNLSNNVKANELGDLFLNDNQKALNAIEQQNFDQALNIANSPDIKGYAAFELGDYETAANAFESLESANAYYNLGNSLVRLGKLEEALKAYDQALSLKEHANAQHNKQLIEDFLKQKDQNQQQDSSDNSDQEQKQPSESEDSSSQSNESNESNSEQSDPQNESEQKDGEQSEDQENNEQAEQQNQEDSKEQAQQSAEQDQQELSPEELRQQQQIESVLNQLETSPGSVTQHKFQYQYQQNPTQEEGTIW